MHETDHDYSLKVLYLILHVVEGAHTKILDPDVFRSIKKCLLPWPCPGFFPEHLSCSAMCTPGAFCHGLCSQESASCVAANHAFLELSEFQGQHPGTITL